MRERRAPRGALVFLGALAFFSLTLYGGVGGRFQCGDAAKWQYIGRILGIPHPPGSPLFILLSHAWSFLPVAPSLAIRANLLSAFFGALCIAFTFASARRLGLSNLATAFTCVILATSESMWTFSTEAEVYAPLAFSYAFVIHRGLVWRETKRDRDLWILFFVYAAGFGIHYMMITLLPALIVLVARVNARAMISPRHVLVAVACIVIALIPFGWLWTHIPDAAYSEFPGARSVRKFRDFLLVRQYRGSMFDQSLRSYWFERFGWGLSVLGRQGGALLLLAPVGAYDLARRDRTPALFLSLAAFVPFLFLIGYRQGDELGDALPALISLSLLVGIGIDLLKGHMLVRAAACAVLLCGVGLNAKALVHVDPMINLTHDTDEAHDYPFNIACIVEGAERNAFVISPFPDYGSRQIVNFYEYADPRVASKALSLRYFDDPPEEWAWAPKRWQPDGRGPVYVFRKDHANELTDAGYKVSPEKFSMFGRCADDHPNLIFYRAEKKR